MSGYVVTIHMVKYDPMDGDRNLAYRKYENDKLVGEFRYGDNGYQLGKEITAQEKIDAVWQD